MTYRRPSRLPSGMCHLAHEHGSNCVTTNDLKLVQMTPNKQALNQMQYFAKYCPVHNGEYAATPHAPNAPCPVCLRTKATKATIKIIQRLMRDKAQAQAMKILLDALRGRKNEKRLAK